MTTNVRDFRPADYSLDGKYTWDDGTIYLTGVQALVRLPVDQHRADQRQGLNTATFVSGYRGSPLGGIDLEFDRQRRLMKEHQVFHQAGLNEELAATAVFGSQMANIFPGAKYDGVLGMWYGKAPGVDRTGDAFRHANYAGTGKNGGVLALAGDDPTSKSSTLPTDSSTALYDAFMPTLYPGNVQEILDYGLHGFMLSRTSGLWVGMKIITNVADGAGTAVVAPDRIRPIIPTVELDGRPYHPELDWKLVPPNNLEMERTLHYARLELARQYARENGLNKIVGATSDAWLGIVAAGKTYYDVRQALSELGLDDEALQTYGVRILQVGMLYPLEPRIVRDFARGLREVLVIEEKRSFLELFTKDILYGMSNRPRIVGKFDEEERPLVPANGEMDSDVIAHIIAGRLQRKSRIPSVQARIAYLNTREKYSLPVGLLRTPYYCSGCPHNRGTTVPDGSIAAAGIGCHSMAIFMDQDAYGELIGITQMGGEGAQWVGAANFTETPHLFQNIGDGTLFHSGILAINFAVASGVNMTYKILYNSAVAMTGGQDAVGMRTVPELVQRLEAEGVKRIIITTEEPGNYKGKHLPIIAEVWHRDRLIEAQTELAKEQGVTILIHDQQCAAEKRRLRKRGKQAEPTGRLFINERVCEGCGDCGQKSNCLSVQAVDTEFGRKTMIHQSSCNKDYSCLLGDCPSFVEVEPSGLPAASKSRPTANAAMVMDTDLPEPVRRCESDGFSLHMMGIGGTGVVTVSQIVGTAAVLEGKDVWGLDQTGLSQKGGPVLSDVKVFDKGRDVSNKITTGGSDLYLGFDLLVATDPANLTKADRDRTVAVISTSEVPTGRMVRDNSLRFPRLSALLSPVEQVTAKDANVYLDALALSEALFGDHMQANLLLLGAAYQAGAVPLSGEAIEEAIRLNGVAVETNLQALRWGRLAVIDPEGVERINHHDEAADEQPPALDARSRALVAQVDASGELQRLLAFRVPELIAYQDESYARRYVELVKEVKRAEEQPGLGRTAISEAVARYFFKLLAYKDEYEVARLHLETAAQAKLAQAFGEKAKVYWRLHPPLFRALGMENKLKLGAWFTPGMKMLRTMKRFRGGALDIFGRTQIRRTERELIDEYERWLRDACDLLTPENYETVKALAELPDMVRGYEQIKLDNVKRYRGEAGRLLAKLGIRTDKRS